MQKGESTMHCKHWTPKPQSDYYVQHMGGVTSLRGRSPKAASLSLWAVNILEEEGEVARFLHTRVGCSWRPGEGFANFPWVQGIGPSHGCVHVSRLHLLLTCGLRASAGCHRSSKPARSTRHEGVVVMVVVEFKKILKQEGKWFHQACKQIPTVHKRLNTAASSEICSHKSQSDLSRWRKINRHSLWFLVLIQKSKVHQCVKYFESLAHTI